MGLNPIQITSDEINRLIYSYFRDSGFEHSAYTLVKEAQLERSPSFAKHIPRGELVELLSKALLYLEVESHFQGGELAANCKACFSLLEPHVCSLTPPEPQPFVAPSIVPIAPTPVVQVLPVPMNATQDLSAKRKASSPPGNENPSEKRLRRDPDEMDVDSSSESKGKAKPTATKKVVAKPARPLAQGPVDDVTDPDAISLLSGHKSEIFVCAFNPVKYNLVATGSKDATVKIWDLPDPTDSSSSPGETVTIGPFSAKDSSDMTSLSWNPEGTLLAIASYDCILRICDTSGQIYFQNSLHQGPIFTTRFSPSGRWLLTASLDGSACLWDVEAKRLHRQYQSHQECCLDVDWISDSMFASCGADRLVHIMSIDEEKSIKTFGGHKDEINQIKCNPSRTRLASCSDDRTTRIWSVSNISPQSEADAIPGLSAGSDQVTILGGHKHAVSTIGWYTLPGIKNELIATGSFDGATRLWDSVTGECLHAFADHKRPVYALSISPNNLWMATGGGDGWLHVYNLKDHDKIWSWFAGPDKPGVFEIDWQGHKEGKIDRLAMALECQKVGVIDICRIPTIRDSV